MRDLILSKELLKLGIAGEHAWVSSKKIDFQDVHMYILTKYYICLKDRRQGYSTNYTWDGMPIKKWVGWNAERVIYSSEPGLWFLLSLLRQKVGGVVNYQTAIFALVDNCGFPCAQNFLWQNKGNGKSQILFRPHSMLQHPNTRFFDGPPSLDVALSSIGHITFDLSAG